MEALYTLNSPPVVPFNSGLRRSIYLIEALYILNSPPVVSFSSEKQARQLALNPAGPLG